MISISGCVLACAQMLTGQYTDRTHFYSDYFDHEVFGSSVSCKVFALCPDLTEIPLWSVSEHQMQGEVAPKLQSLHPAENIWDNHKPALRFCVICTLCSSLPSSPCVCAPGGKMPMPNAAKQRILKISQAKW